MSYYGFKKRPAKVSTQQKLTRKLDDIFSEYVRIREADEEGMVTCITCPDRFHWTEVDCGHFVLRGNMATRWHLKNGHPQCRLCNSTQDGKEDEHARAIDEKYGPGSAELLRKIGREEAHFSDHELEGMYQELRAEVKAIRAEKGMI